MCHQLVWISMTWQNWRLSSIKGNGVSRRAGIMSTITVCQRRMWDSSHTGAAPATWGINILKWVKPTLWGGVGMIGEFHAQEGVSTGRHHKFSWWQQSRGSSGKTLYPRKSTLGLISSWGTYSQRRPNRPSQGVRHRAWELISNHESDLIKSSQRPKGLDIANFVELHTTAI